MWLLANLSFQVGSLGAQVSRNHRIPAMQRQRYGFNRSKTMVQKHSGGSRGRREAPVEFAAEEWVAGAEVG